jgi:hypothetical protein
MEAEIGLTVTNLLVALIGLITSLVMTGLRFASDGINKLPKPLKAALVGAISIPIAWLSGVVGIDLPADPTVWDGVLVNSVLTWLAAMGINAAGTSLLKE